MGLWSEFAKLSSARRSLEQLRDILKNAKDADSGGELSISYVNNTWVVFLAGYGAKNKDLIDALIDIINQWNDQTTQP